MCILSDNNYAILTLCWVSSDNTWTLTSDPWALSHTIQVQQWNQDVLEFLASLPLEDMTAGEATTHLSRIDDLHDLVHISQLNTMTELANSLPGEKKFKKMAEKAKEKWVGWLVVFPCVLSRHLFRGWGAQEFPIPEIDFHSLEFLKCI